MTILRSLTALAFAFGAFTCGAQAQGFANGTDVKRQFVQRTAFPGRCDPGDLVTRIDQTPGVNNYICGNANDWNALGLPVIAFSTLTDAATVTWVIGSSPAANATLTFTAHSGSRTLNLTGLANGGSYVLRIIQDATGGEGLTLGTGCTWKVSGGGSGAVTPSTAATAIDVLAFTYDGTSGTCNANFNKNFN